MAREYTMAPETSGQEVQGSEPTPDAAAAAL